MSWDKIEIIEEEVGVQREMIYIGKYGTDPTEDRVYSFYVQFFTKKDAHT